MSVARLDCLAARVLVISGNPLGLVEVESIFSARVLLRFVAAAAAGGCGGAWGDTELGRNSRGGRKVGQVGPCENMRLMGCRDAIYRGRCGPL